MCILGHFVVVTSNIILTRNKYFGSFLRIYSVFLIFLSVLVFCHYCECVIFPFLALTTYSLFSYLTKILIFMTF